MGRSFVSVQFPSQAEGPRTQVASVLLQIKVLARLVVLQSRTGGKVDVAHRTMELLVVGLHVRPEGFSGVLLAANFTHRLFLQRTVRF